MRFRKHTLLRYMMLVVAVFSATAMPAVMVGCNTVEGAGEGIAEDAREVDREIDEEFD